MSCHANIQMSLDEVTNRFILIGGTCLKNVYCGQKLSHSLDLTWFRGICNKAHINNLRNCFVEVYLNCSCCLSDYNVMERGERLLQLTSFSTSRVLSINPIHCIIYVSFCTDKESSFLFILIKIYQNVTELIHDRWFEFDKILFVESVPLTAHKTLKAVLNWY